MTDLMLALKGGTAEHHDRLDRRSRMTRLLAPDLSRDEYSRLVRRLWRYYEPLEGEIERHAGRSEFLRAIDWRKRRRKAGALRRDLECLGVARTGNR
jgi:heme oxygenase